MADEATAAAASAFMGGANPFQWATLGAGLLGKAASSVQPAGPSSADALYGSVQFTPDFSNWVVASGNGAAASLTTGDKTGPIQAPSQNFDKVQVPVAANTAPAYTPTLYGSTGGGALYGQSGYSTATPAAPVGPIASIPTLWILIGFGIWALTKK